MQMWNLDPINQSLKFMLNIKKLNKIYIELHPPNIYSNHILPSIQKLKPDVVYIKSHS